MFKHLWVERGMLSCLTKTTCILVIVTNNEPILSSMPATSTTWAGNSSRSVAIEFLSQITNTRTHIIRYVHTYYLESERA